ncbi:MAG: DUF4230 domain-containing protein [Ardenticatenaceae bacterium]
MAYGYSQRREGSGCWPALGNFLLMVMGGVIVLALVLMFGLWWAGDRFAQGINTIFNQPQPTPQVDVRSVVLEQVRGASELTTAIWSGHAIVPASKVRRLLGFDIAETRILYIAVGEVRAGVDLSQIEREDVEVLSDTIRVQLPPPQLIHSSIDVNRSGVYDYDQGFLGLGPDAPELQTLAEQRGLTELLIAACDSGILETANGEAQLVVTQLLSTTGFRQVIVETQPPPASECPGPE